MRGTGSLGTERLQRSVPFSFASKVAQMVDRLDAILVDGPDYADFANLRAFA